MGLKISFALWGFDPYMQRSFSPSPPAPKGKTSND
jgi:hypothetical protein